MTRAEALAKAKMELIRYCELHQIRSAFRLAFDDVSEEEITRFLERQEERSTRAITNALEHLDTQLAEVERALEAER